MLPTSQLMDLTGQLVALKTCYELTEPEMQKQADCPHCHLNLAENDSKPVHGRLGQIEDKADEVLNGWTNTLKSALEDPMLEEQKALLGKNARTAIDKAGTCPSLWISSSSIVSTPCCRPGEFGSTHG